MLGFEASADARPEVGRRALLLATHPHQAAHRLLEVEQVQAADALVQMDVHLDDVLV